jgi:hypothetical protein
MSMNPHPRLLLCSMFAVGCAWVQVGCADPDGCLRHSDCPTGYSCQHGHCLLEPAAETADGGDAAATESDGAADAESQDPDAG